MPLYAPVTPAGTALVGGVHLKRLLAKTPEEAWRLLVEDTGWLVEELQAAGYTIEEWPDWPGR